MVQGGQVYVEKVRDLIDKLEECPGRNDFWLKTPEWSPKDLHAANATSQRRGKAKRSSKRDNGDGVRRL